MHMNVCKRIHGISNRRLLKLMGITSYSETVSHDSLKKLFEIIVIAQKTAVAANPRVLSIQFMLTGASCSMR